MLKFIARRFVNYLVLVFIATSLAYILGSLTLDPRARYEGRMPPIPPAAIHANLQERNADPSTPVLVRYGRWLKGVVHGDFGKQIVGEDTVSSEMKRRIGVSLRLLLLGTIFGAVGGVLVGVLGAVRQRKPVDVGLHVRLLRAAGLADRGGDHRGADPSSSGYYHRAARCSRPPASTTRRCTASHFWTDRAKRLIMPTMVLALFGISFFSRYQRSAMLDVLGSDFLRTARAKGLTRQRALFKHGVRTALIPIVTFFAYSFGLLLTGAIFTEKLFGWHGMGEYLVQSVQSARRERRGRGGLLHRGAGAVVRPAVRRPLCRARSARAVEVGGARCPCHHRRSSRSPRRRWRIRTRSTSNSGNTEADLARPADPASGSCGRSPGWSALVVLVLIFLLAYLGPVPDALALRRLRSGQHPDRPEQQPLLRSGRDRSGRLRPDPEGPAEVADHRPGRGAGDHRHRRGGRLHRRLLRPVRRHRRGLDHRPAAGAARLPDPGHPEPGAVRPDLAVAGGAAVGLRLDDHRPGGARHDDEPEGAGVRARGQVHGRASRSRSSAGTCCPTWPRC